MSGSGAGELVLIHRVSRELASQLWPAYGLAGVLPHLQRAADPKHAPATLEHASLASEASDRLRVSASTRGDCKEGS